MLESDPPRSPQDPIAANGQAERPTRLVRGKGPVVIVDDNPGDVELARIAYEESVLDNEWLSFTGGEPFLAHMEAVRSGEAMPALVLLDLNMPDLTGFEILDRVRSDPFFLDLPIFCMLTSSGDPRARDKAREMGTSGFMVKQHALDGYVAFFNGLRE